MDISVMVTPGAKTARILKVHDAPGRIPLYRVSVKRRAEKGRANEAVRRLLAEYFAVPVSSITIRSGHTARTKLVRIDGPIRPLL